MMTLPVCMRSFSTARFSTDWAVLRYALFGAENGQKDELNDGYGSTHKPVLRNGMHIII